MQLQNLKKNQSHIRLCILKISFLYINIYNYVVYSLYIIQDTYYQSTFHKKKEISQFKIEILKTYIAIQFEYKLFKYIVKNRK